MRILRSHVVKAFSVNPLDVLQKHEMQGKESCVAWGLEFILKVHDKIKIDDYPIQKKYPSGLGFGDEADRLLSPHKIVKCDKSFAFPDFQKDVEAELKAGRYPIFSLPVSVNLDMYRQTFGDFNCHICAVVPLNNQTKYMTRQVGNPQILDIAFHPFYSFLRSQIKHDYKVHYLSYLLK